MFRNLADCIETLEDAGARFYTITGPGVNLSFDPEDDAAATVENSLVRFQRDFEKMGPGLYTVLHKKQRAANRNQSSFRFVKVADGTAVGTTAGADGFALADMQLKMQQMQHDNEIKWLKRDYEEQLAKLKSKENQPDGLDKLASIAGHISQLAQHAKALPPAVVAGPAPQPAAPAVPVDEQEQVVDDTVQALHHALGGDDAVTLDVLRKIGKVAKENPGQIQSIVNFL